MNQLFRIETGSNSLGLVYSIDHFLCRDLWSKLAFDTIIETRTVMNEGEIDEFSDSGDDTYKP